MGLQAHIRLWFTFNKKERVGIIILCLLIVLLWILPVFFSDPGIPDEVLPISPIRIDSAKAIIIRQKGNQGAPSRAFNFNKAGKPDYNYAKTEQKKLDLNQADSTALEHLPGIGEKLSSRIVRYREKLGGFVSIEQLREVYGLSDSTFYFISKFLQVAPGFKPVQVAVNKADYATLRRHPYLSAGTIKAFLAYRKTNGKIADFKSCDLIARRVGDSLSLKFIPYLDFSD